MNLSTRKINSAIKVYVTRIFYVFFRQIFSFYLVEFFILEVGGMRGRFKKGEKIALLKYIVCLL